ncbi:MAG: HlyC/CorC family transporter [Acidobacteria bacterium]|nr:HlyC/CorC family transporter [Acidobacteriota bacterium]
MLELLVVVGLVVGTSAACSLFEAVLYSVPASRIEALDRANRPSGRILKEMRQQVDRPIAAVLSLNTIANTGGGALAGALAAGAFGAARIWVFSLVFTLAILLISEVLPKTVGVVYARALAPFVARPLAWLVAFFRPLIALTQLATRAVRSESQEHRISDDELLTMVRLGLRSGDFRPHEARVIQNVLALERRTVSEVMTPRPVVFILGAAVTVRDAAAMAELDEYSRIPVYASDPEELVGVVHKVDILKAVAEDRFETTLEKMMRPINFVVAAAPLDRVLRTFLARRGHMLAVIDEFGGFAGIVTLEDVLEELIGREIVDEFDQVTDLRAFARRRRLMATQRESAGDS